MSGAGGVSRAVERAVAIGAAAVQVFVDQSRRYPRAELPVDELDRLGALLAAHGLPGYVHVPYLANVATADAILRSHSIDMVSRALRASGRAGLRAVVVHPGSHLGRGFAAVREQIVLALGEAWAHANVDIPILLENMAGAGGLVGATVTELRTLVTVDAGLCFDTAHGHAAGWDLSRASGLTRFRAEWRELLPDVRLVHANDSRAAAGTRRDLHANPGEGTIGARGFRMLAEVPELRRVPWILEVPGHDHSGPRAVDVRRLRAYVSGARVGGPSAAGHIRKTP